MNRFSGERRKKTLTTRMIAKGAFVFRKLKFNFQHVQRNLTSDILSISLFCNTFCQKDKIKNGKPL